MSGMHSMSCMNQPCLLSVAAGMSVGMVITVLQMCVYMHVQWFSPVILLSISDKSGTFNLYSLQSIVCV